MRNRRVQSTGRPNEVLLDENLVQCMRRLSIPPRFHALTALCQLRTYSRFICENIRNESCGVLYGTTANS